MLPASSVRVWLAAGTTDMRRGMNGLALQVQQSLNRDPHAGDVYVSAAAEQSLEDPFARRPWHVALRQAAGMRTIHLAIASRWRRRYHGGAAWLHARRHRLAASAKDLAA
jgi:transposase